MDSFRLLIMDFKVEDGVSNFTFYKFHFTFNPCGSNIQGRKYERMREIKREEEEGRGGTLCESYIRLFLIGFIHRFIFVITSFQNLNEQII